MKKIIVPIDFSEYSEYALETAAYFAKKYNVEILALHMLELSNAVLTTADGYQENASIFYIKLAETKFEKLLELDFLKDVKVTPIIKHFKIFSEVNDVAQEHDADLIIMGSHGASGLKELFIGSNTEKVVRYSDVPVLIIKHHPILTDFEHVAFACDFSFESVKPYVKARELFDLLHIKMHLVYVNMPNYRFRSSSEMESKVVTFLKKADGNLDRMSDVVYVNDYSIEQGILNTAVLIGADLVSLVTHGRTGISHFFEGSISEDVANHSALPVMTFKI